MAYLSDGLPSGAGTPGNPIVLPETVVRANDNRGLLLVLVLVALWWFSRGSRGDA